MVQEALPTLSSPRAGQIKASLSCLYPETLEMGRCTCMSGNKCQPRELAAWQDVVFRWDIQEQGTCQLWPEASAWIKETEALARVQAHPHAHACSSFKPLAKDPISSYPLLPLQHNLSFPFLSHCHTKTSCNSNKPLLDHKDRSGNRLGLLKMSGMLPRAGSLSPTSPAPRASVKGLKSRAKESGDVRAGWTSRRPGTVGSLFARRAVGKSPQKACYSDGNQGLAPSREEEEGCWLLTNSKKIAGRVWMGKRIRGHGNGGGGRCSPAHPRHKWMLEGGEQGGIKPFVCEGKGAPGNLPHEKQMQ